MIVLAWIRSSSSRSKLRSPANFAGIMSAHVTFPAIDPTPGMPATLSRPVLTGLLRDELGFQGLIATDSLEMGALAENGYPPPVGAALAFAAGADLLLFNRDHAMHTAGFCQFVAGCQGRKNFAGTTGRICSPNFGSQRKIWGS